MSKCTTTYTLTSVAEDCLLSKGGITELYVTKFNELEEGFYIADGEDFTVDAEKMGTVYQIFVRPNQTQYTTEYQSETANGLPVYSTTLSFNMMRMNKEKRIEVMALLSNEIAVMVRDKNGEYHFIGAFASCEAVDGTVASTGLSKADINQYSVNLKCEEAFLPIILKDTEAEAIKNKITA